MNQETLLIVGNVLSTIATLLFILCGVIKRKENVLKIHCVAHMFYMISEIITSLWSSVIQEIVSLFRNITILIKKNTKVLNIIFIIISLVVGVSINILTRPEGAPWYGNWYGYCSVIACVEFSIVVLFFNSPIAVKVGQGFSGLLWSINFLMGGLYGAAILNLINGIASFLGIILIKRKNKGIIKGGN